MKLDGFSVDSISSFCRHFYLPDLLEAIDTQVVFSKWLHDILAVGNVEQTMVTQIKKLEDVFEAWISGSYGSKFSIFDGVCRKQLYDGGMSRQYELWKNEVDKENVIRYQHICFILSALFEIGQYSVNEEDKQIIYAFLRQQNLLKKQKLSLHLTGSRKVNLYFGNDLITQLPVVDATWTKSKHIISMEQHPDTGYLAITQTGELVNGSAFTIALPVYKTVKVQINQIAYAVLLEDGSILHNLKFSETPDYPVKNISLQGEQLSWIAI